MTKKNNQSENYTKKLLSEKILAFYISQPVTGFNYKQIAKAFGITDSATKQMITAVLAELCNNEILEELYTGKYTLKQKELIVTGTIEISNNGIGIVKTEDSLKEIFIHPTNMNKALHGDKVKIIMHKKRKGFGDQGEVIEILERANKTFVGTIKMNSPTGFAFLVPDFKQLGYDIFIPAKSLNKAKDGFKAVVKIVEWDNNSKSPTGEVVEILGKAGEHETEIHAIMAEFDLPYTFPEKTKIAAEKIPEKISNKDIISRKDFREITTFTIDPVDAKDFDDALSFHKLENGHIEIGIHIADVTHYVTPGDVLDQEAQQRATSVYLVDRVVPMLPEKLSNVICSLRPNEDKLCFSSVFEIDSKGNIFNEWFGKTIIHSNRRYSYEEAQQIIETGNGDYAEELQTLNSIAKKLREERFKKGAIGFERSEVKFELGEKGKPIRVFFKEAKDSNRLIEEFMLLANKKVAELLGKKSSDKRGICVYRIHDKPDSEKLKNFSVFLKNFGYKINADNPKLIAQSINKLLAELEGKQEKDVIESLAIRSMAKAIYSTKNIGHYGLGFTFYTHFTSPIRRFPDMMVHRLLNAYLEKKPETQEKNYEKLCKHSSEKEHKATEAERASIKFKQVEFLSDKIGQVFEGIISGVTEYGLYVEIKENKCEGLVSIRDLKDDFYHFEPQQFCLIGKRKKNRYKLGDTVNVEIVRTNIFKKQIDFKLA